MVNTLRDLHRFCLACCVAAVVACAPDDAPITQLILVADTDIVGIDSIQFRVSALDHVDVPLATATHAAGSEPAYVSLVRDEGSLGPLTVTATGLSQGQVRLVRTQRVSFVPDETRVVLLHLHASCLGPSAKQCDAMSQTCSKTGCIAQSLSEAELAPWRGSPPRLDEVSTVDGGAGRAPGSDAGSPPRLSMCGADVFDTQHDVNHCGGCDISCSLFIPAILHAVNACEDGLCAYACMSGWAGCDGKLENGCEADITKNEHCGSCTTKCAKGQQCMSGICVMP